MTDHRTRKRDRHPAQPKKREPDDTELELAELIVLWPRLDAALGSDMSGPSAEPRISGSGDGTSKAVINLDVEQAAADIITGVDQITAEIERILNLGRDWRPSRKRLKAARANLDTARAALAHAVQLRAEAHVQVVDLPAPGPDDDPTTHAIAADELARADMRLATARIDLTRADRAVYRAERDVVRSATGEALARMPDWYVQLTNRQQPLAAHIAKDAKRWNRKAREALCLRTRERPIGWLCPNHRDDNPTELVKDADEATLAPAILAGRPQQHATAPLTWRHAESVYCPRCNERWSGISELRVLMRMIEQLTNTTTTTEEPTDG